jgi:hypothetical protein
VLLQGGAAAAIKCWLTWRDLGLLDGESKQLCQLLGPLLLSPLLVLAGWLRPSIHGALRALLHLLHVLLDLGGLALVLQAKRLVLHRLLLLRLRSVQWQWRRVSAVGPNRVAAGGTGQLEAAALGLTVIQTQQRALRANEHAASGQRRTDLRCSGLFGRHGASTNSRCHAVIESARPRGDGLERG